MYPYLPPKPTFEEQIEWFEGRILNLTARLEKSHIASHGRLRRHIKETIDLLDHLKDMSTGATTEVVRFEKHCYVPRT